MTFLSKAALAAGFLALATPVTAQNTMVGGAEMFADKNIVENAAFAKLPKAAVDDLLKPENKDKLAQILTCHVVAVDAHSPAIGKMIMDDGGKHPVKTVGGCTLTASIGANNELMLTDENGTMATVTIPDVEQSNGVIHVIDTVLMPKM